MEHFGTYSVAYLGALTGPARVVCWVDTGFVLVDAGCPVGSVLRFGGVQQDLQ